MTVWKLANERSNKIAALGRRLAFLKGRNLLTTLPPLSSIALLILMVLMSHTTASETAVTDNQELARLFRQDQADRTVSSADRSVVSELDAERRQTVIEAFRKGEIRSAQDYFHAGFIFHHGSSVEDSRIAYSFASLSLTLDPESTRKRWLVAASWDRIMVKHKRAQWYGTQITRRASDGAWATHETDWDATSDDEKTYFGVMRPGSEPWIPPRGYDSREPIVVPRVPR